MFEIDPYLINIVILCFVALAFAMVFRYFKQPSVVAYIITGLFLGSSGLGLVTDQNLLSQVGYFGVMLLLFFAGMELDISRLVKNWRVALVGTLLQIAISVLAVFILGLFMDWNFKSVLLLGFVISLSSTSVILKILENKNLIKSKVGTDVISILIIQDFAVVPMLIAISSMSGSLDIGEIILQIAGTVLIVFFIYRVLKKKEFHLPFKSKIKQDHELQLLAALVLCFGFSIITSLFHLSAALGAFIAGIFVAVSKETDWIHRNLHSFKVLFIALFFVSIGMMINLSFVIENLGVVLLVVLLVFLTNTFVNAAVFFWLRKSWCYSLYAGALLAQIGEFSFFLVAVGLEVGLINIFAYQLTLAVIALSLLLSPFWIAFFEKFVYRFAKDCAL